MLYFSVFGGTRLVGSLCADESGTDSAPCDALRAVHLFCRVLVLLGGI